MNRPEIPLTIPRSPVLHVTNGHVFQERIRSLGMEGAFLPWMDVLHEGPVPHLSLRELTPLRAHYISLKGWGAFYTVLNELQKRDDLFLTALAEPGEIVLWFEEDLYDQLQLMQIVSEICRVEDTPARIALVQTPKNLMSYSDNELRRLFAFRTPLTNGMLSDASAAWEAFTAQTAQAMNALRSRHFEHLPLIKPALMRLMEEFPSAKTGLGKVETWILQLLAHGFDTPGQLFSEYQKLEPSPYLGDTTFLTYLDRLCASHVPVVELVTPEEESEGEYPMPNVWQQKYKLTMYGELILQGEMHALEIRGIQRWIGGVKLQENNMTWVWNEESEQIEHTFM